MLSAISPTPIMWASALTSSVFGITIFANIIILVIERHLTRGDQQNIRLHFYLPLGAAGLGLAICVLALVMAGSWSALFAACCGLVTVGIIYFVRRTGLDWLAATGIAIVALVGAALFVSSKAQPAIVDFSLRYAGRAAPDRLAVASRIIDEVGLGGSGAGTLRAILPIYAAPGVAATTISVPTFAAQIAIELGRPALWVVVAATIALIVLCARGALIRGRDFFYSLTGAGVAVSALMLAFCENGLQHTAVQILLAATLGVALVQSMSCAVDRRL